MKNFKKEKLKKLEGYIFLDMYPVYVDAIYDGHEPLKIVGIRKDEIELEGDYSGGTHGLKQKEWFKISKCFIVREICNEELATNGCQVPNVHCCGGGSVIRKHKEYWKD